MNFPSCLILKACQALTRGAKFAALLAPLLFSLPLQAQDSARLLAQERERLEALKAEADRLSAAAARAGAQGKHQQAVEFYAQVIELLPDSASFALKRERSAQAWLDAALTSSQLQIANGEPDAAAATLQVLAEHPLTRNNQELKLVLEDLQPVLEPAHTPEFDAKVAEVVLFLRQAESQLRISEYDKASATYERVLSIDPTNSAARRGLELVARAKAEYGEDARAQTRAELLSEVTLGWELPPQVPERGRTQGAKPATDLSTSELPLKQRQRLALRETVIESIELLDLPLTEALDMVRLMLRDKGVAMDFVAADAELENVPVTLSLAQISAEEVLNLIAQQSKTSWNIERGAVVFFAEGRGVRRFAQSYSLDPALYRELTLPSGPSAAPSEDIFSPVANLAVAEVSLEDVLQQAGISWDEATTAAYLQSTGSLSFSGTQSQHDQLQGLLNDLNSRKGRQVRIELRFIRVSLNADEELSFETLLGSSNIGSERIFGAGGTPSNGDNLPFNFPGSDPLVPVGSNLLSAGLRSGQEATGSAVLDQIINNFDTLSTTNVLRAPDIFGLGGVFTDPQFQILMRGLNQRGGVDILAKPAVLAPSGQRATISQIEQIIYPADYDPPELPQSIGNFNNSVDADEQGSAPSVPVVPAQPRDFTEDFEGIVLDVTPTVSTDGNFITLEVRPEIRFLDGFINYGTPITQVSSSAIGGFVTQTISENLILQPVFRSYNLTTRVTLEDGQSLVLGGLMRNDVISYEDKIPFLGDIPFLGRLFQSKGKQEFKEAIIFVISADVLDIGGQPINPRR